MSGFSRTDHCGAGPSPGDDRCARGERDVGASVDNACVSPDAYVRWMAEALVEARRAREAGEVPIGAVVVLGDTIVGRGFNQPIRTADPTAHAEIVAIRAAAGTLGNYRLTGATLIVTIEPCLMCVGAIVHARIGTVVFGAVEPRCGALVSTVRAGELAGHNHRFEVVAGVSEAECREAIQAFFRERRQAPSPGAMP